MRIFRSSKGSASVEASLVFPLVILVLITMLIIGVRMLDKVRSSANISRAYALETMEPVMPAEKLLRLKWLGIRIVEETTDSD